MFCISVIASLTPSFWKAGHDWRIVAAMYFGSSSPRLSNAGTPLGSTSDEECAAAAGAEPVSLPNSDAAFARLSSGASCFSAATRSLRIFVRTAASASHCSNARTNASLCFASAIG